MRARVGPGQAAVDRFAAPLMCSRLFAINRGFAIVGGLYRPSFDPRHRCWQHRAQASQRRILCRHGMDHTPATPGKRTRLHDHHSVMKYASTQRPQR